MTLSPEPYPNAYTLEGICHEAMGNNIDKFAQYCTPDFQVESAGQDHSMKGLFDSASGLKDHRSQFVSMLDEKTIKREVVRVIGGGQQPWAAVECMTTATTNAGKPYKHELVVLVKFNLDGKICYVKTFYDTKHIDGHVDENKAQEIKA